MSPLLRKKKKSTSRSKVDPKVKPPEAPPFGGREDSVISRHGDPARAGMGQDRSRQKTKVRELAWSEFDRMVQKLARAIQKSFQPEAVVGVAHGGVFVGGALASALGAEFFPVRISRRSRDSRARNRKAPKLLGEMPAELKGRRVLIVDDVASSGDTLELARRLAKDVGGKELHTASLIRRKDGFAPDWSALTTEELVVFPWDYQTVAEDGRFDVDPDKAGA